LRDSARESRGAVAEDPVAELDRAAKSCLIWAAWESARIAPGFETGSASIEAARGGFGFVDPAALARRARLLQVRAGQGGEIEPFGSAGDAGFEGRDVVGLRPAWRRARNR
jgi:hypothetical protein